VGNHTLARFDGEYDLFGNQVYSKGQILFDTVRRFKGQQAKVRARFAVAAEPRTGFALHALGARLRPTEIHAAATTAGRSSHPKSERTTHGCPCRGHVPFRTAADRRL
jgi:hypothetical protein